MKELIEKYADWLLHNKGRSSATVAKYEGYLEQLLTWCSEQNLNPEALTIEDLELFTGKFAHQQGLKPSARKPLIACIRGFYKWAYEYKHLASNPAANLPYPQLGQKMPVPIDLENAEKMLLQADLNTFKGVRDAAMMAVLYGCGLRVSGLVNLNEEDLTLTQMDGQEVLIILAREKGKKERYVPAPHETRLLIRAYLSHPELAEIDRTLPKGGKVLFVSLGNKKVPAHNYHGEQRRLAARSINDMLDTYGKKAGVPAGQRHPHAGRHLYGKELAEEDTNLLVQQALMGHSDADSTAIYAHLAMRKLFKAVEKANPLSKMNTPATALARRLRNGG